MERDRRVTSTISRPVTPGSGELTRPACRAGTSRLPESPDDRGVESLQLLCVYPQLAVPATADLLRVIVIDNIRANVELSDVADVRLPLVLRVPVAGDLLCVLEIGTG